MRSRSGIARPLRLRWSRLLRVAPTVPKAPERQYDRALLLWFVWTAMRQRDQCLRIRPVVSRKRQSSNSQCESKGRTRGAHCLHPELGGSDEDGAVRGAGHNVA
jgi:hypothetical protein